MFNLQSFNYNQNALTVLTDNDGNILFDAAEVCQILGYERRASNVLERIDADEKVLLNRIDFATSDATSDVASLPKEGGAQYKYFVYEAGLYSLILGSDKPEAKQFKRFVTHEILPSIRKTGKYECQAPSRLDRVSQMTGRTPTDVLDSEMKYAKSLARRYGLRGNQVLLAAGKYLKKIYEIDTQLALDVALPSTRQEKLYTATEIGKELGQSARAVNLKLAELGLLEKDVKGEWKLTAKGLEYGQYLDVGKAHSDGTPIQQIKWLESTVELMKNVGIMAKV